MYRLALRVGEWDVDGMLDRMTSRQRAMWEAFYEMEPWGEQRDDLRTGMLISAIDRFLHGDEAQFEPGHAILKFKRKKKGSGEKGQSAEQQIAALKSIMAGMGGS